MVHTFGKLQRKFIKLFTLCWLVCPAMQCRMGEEGSCPARQVQIYQWFKLLESCKGSLFNPSPFQGCALCVCVCVPYTEVLGRRGVARPGRSKSIRGSTSRPNPSPTHLCPMDLLPKALGQNVSFGDAPTKPFKYLIWLQEDIW